MTRNMQIFSDRAEFLSLLQQAIDSLKLVVILYRNGRDPVTTLAGRAVTAKQIEAFGASRLYIAEDDLDTASLDAKHLEPARLGLLQIDLPREEGGKLFMAQLAVKTDSYDQATGSRFENHQLGKFFDKVGLQLRRKLKRSVLAENIKTGKKSVYDDIWFAPSARKFVDGGGELMQEGVENVRFHLQPNSGH